MLRIKTVNVYNLEDIPAMAAAEIIQGVTQEGCLLIRQTGGAAVNHSLALSRLGRHFGSPIRHRLSDEVGVHPIRNIAGYPRYANTTNADLLLHTDGSFEESPPQVMLMSCEQPAPSGGHSRISRARDIYDHLRREAPEDLAGLWLADSFTITRDDRKSSKPVFKEVEDGRIAMTFRFGSDVEIDVHAKAVRGYQRIVALLSDPANFIEFKLQPNELLAFDNTAVLHGRTDFPPDAGRVLHGLWLDGEPGGKRLPLGFKL
ncbi:TauD/TfdA family dioxygenase [Aestuariivirga sp.]|uniref:TauD/TfdA family dioxygenase n=1 Tax=Aestuariivirga sp. TaxID=2650926 RepID=UPI003BAC2F3C